MAQTMGATPRQHRMTRRRTSSVEQQHAVRPNGGYYSETTSRNKSNRKGGYDDPSSEAPAQFRMRRRRSTGIFETQNNNHQPQRQLSPLPKAVSRRHPSQSDEEEGESSDNSSGSGAEGGYRSEKDENDSQSSSNRSLEESNKGSYSSNYNNNNNNNSNSSSSNLHNNNYTTIPITPVGTKRTKPIRLNSNGKGNINSNRSSNGSKSDPELGSDSLHKRALHEAGLPISVLRGNHNTTIHNDRTILRTESDGGNSESSQPNEYMVVDGDSTKGRLHVVPGMDHPNGEAPMRTNSSRFSDKIVASKVWKILRSKNPIFLLLVTGVSMLGVGLYTQSYATLTVTLDQVISNTNERRRRVTGHFDSIEKDISNLERQLLELHPDAAVLLSSVATIADDDQSELEGSADNSEDDETANANSQAPPVSGMFDEIVAVKERMRLENSKISAFEKYIQDSSLRYATRKYGTGSIRVQLTLEFLSERSTVSAVGEKGGGSGEKLRTTHSPGGPATFKSPHNLVLEMAPLNLMPHSVYTFLEMVDAKLFDGCSFILNAMNVIKAAPLPYEKGTSAKKMNAAFHKMGFDNGVSFREYNPEYPHEQYTVGFAADGSPSFYINTDNNTEEHAGEPCFARIVSGFDTVEKMEAEPVRSGMWYKKRIGIKRAMIL